MSPKQRSSTLLAALLLLVPVAVLLGALARGLPTPERADVPNWTPMSGTTGH